MPVYAFTSDDKEKLADGELLTIDSAVDEATGTIKLKATFPNTDDRLWPGQSISAHLLLTTQNDALTVPQACALQRGPNGLFVYVVDAKQQGRRCSPVETSENFGDYVVVVSAGLADGDLVVTNGQSRLQPGVKVAVKADDKAGDKPGASPGDKAAAKADAKGDTGESAVSGEHFVAFHSTPGRHIPFYGGDPRGRRRGLSLPAHRRPADGRFPDDFGLRQPARRQPRNHGVRGRTAARAPVLADPGPRPDDLHQHPGQHPGDAAVRARPQCRRRRPGRAVGDQRRRRPAAPRPCRRRPTSTRSTRPTRRWSASATSPTSCR